MPVTRRRLIEAFGTAGVGLVSAGCLGQSEGATTDTPTETRTGTDTPTATRTATPASRTTTTSTTTAADRDGRVPMGETVTVGDARMTVENPRVRNAVVVRGMAHTRVVAREGQFVVVDVLIDGEQLGERADLDLRSAVEGEELPESDPLAPIVDEPSSYAFPFPAERHDAAAILHATAESRIAWRLPATVRERLAAEPAFAVSGLRVPKRDGERTLELTVANEGERDGTFAARVSLEGFSGGSIVEFPVHAGESRTYTGRPDDLLLYLENQDGGTVTVQYPADDGLTTVERTVRLSRTTTGSKA